MSVKTNHHPTGKDIVPRPDDNEQTKIKRSLNMKQSDRFARCRGKSRVRVKRFEAMGDDTHSAKDHICEECRCRYVAGNGTDHYGVGYCYRHEGVTGMTKKASETMVAVQKEAIMQGYPDRVYKYKTNQAWIDDVRRSAEEAGGTTDLREEVNVLRTMAQELMSKFQDRDRMTEGYDKEGIAREMTDATYYKLLSTLMTSVGKLTISNLTVTEHDYVHVDQVNIWFAQVIQLLRQHVESAHPDIYEDMVTGIKLIPTMKKGRIT